MVKWPYYDKGNRHVHISCKKLTESKFSTTFPVPFFLKKKEAAVSKEDLENSKPKTVQLCTMYMIYCETFFS